MNCFFFLLCESKYFFRPLSASELAVGCSNGVYIWNIEPNSIVTRPSITCATLLTKPGHKYITSISWNQQVHSFN